MEKAKLAGINLAMQTPFNEDGSINLKVYEELIDKYIDAGVHGLVLGAYMSINSIDQLNSIKGSGGRQDHRHRGGVGRDARDDERNQTVRSAVSKIRALVRRWPVCSCRSTTSHI